jgi:hypothetical protein
MIASAHAIFFSLPFLDKSAFHVAAFVLKGSESQASSADC